MVFIVSEGVLTKSETGAITGAFYIAYAFLQLVGGALADRWHPERLLTIGFVGAGIANFVMQPRNIAWAMSGDSRCQRKKIE